MSGAPTTEGGTQVTGGTGGTTFSLLSSIGSDLSVSVSFNIARELLEGANDLQMGEDELIGLVGRATTTLSPGGKVFIRGEYWNAIAEGEVAEGESVEVTAVNGLELRVRRAGDE